MVFYPSDGIGKEEANNIVKVGTPDSRFIIITGRDKEQEARELVKNGAEDYVFIDEMLRLQYKSFRNYAVFDSILSVLIAAESLLVLLLLTDKYSGGMLSIADFTMYFSTVISLTAALSAFTEQIENYNCQILNVNDYRKLIDMYTQENDSVIENVVRIDESERIKIVFDNVSFSYPGNDSKAIDSVNLTVAAGEKLVIVGLNGAGKTTLIKLLCKFYRPTAGKIILNDVDIWNIPNSEYCRLIAAVFQDYTNFYFTLAENISLDENGNTERMHEILNGDLFGFAELKSENRNAFESYT
jgi:ABC-type multidrug transport system fused ATPase/permease subunit